MRLYIVRHGEAERRASTDAERALTDRGRDQVRALWQRLAREGVQVGQLVNSPFVRARQTADEIAGFFPDAIRGEEPLLVPEAAAGAVMQWLLERGGQDDAMVLVSHMPLVAQLTGALVESESARVPFSVGTVACLDMEVAAVGGARLLWLRAPESGSNAPGVV